MRKRVALVAYHIIAWLLLDLVHRVTCTKWAVATDDKCVFTVSGNWTILFEVHPSLFVTYLAAASPSACRTECCEHHSCNGYVYDSSSVLDSCKLLKCSREGLDCKDALVRYDKHARGEVGFITGLADNADKNESSRGITTSAAGTRTSHQGHETPSVKANTSAENKEEVNEHGGEVYADDDRGIDLGTATAAPSEIEEPGVNNLTYYGNQLLEYREDIKEHTNSISLTIAFLFGMAFLVTVLCLTGRRWLEGLKEGQQKGYTRISYLLNGV